MKTIYLGLLMAAFNVSWVYSQSGKTIFVKAGEDIAKAYSPHGFYRLPQFGKAVLFRHTGNNTSTLLFNYNILSAKIQFINNEGDTLDLINPSLFDSIVIEKNVFYYSDGFLELVDRANSLRLVKKTRIKMRPESIGAYGQSSPTSATDKISSYTVGVNVYSFSLSENMTVKENIDWFWMDHTGLLRKASKANLMLMLTVEEQEKAQAWLKQHKTNFEKETDLRQLIEAL